MVNFSQLLNEFSVNSFDLSDHCMVSAFFDVIADEVCRAARCMAHGFVLDALVLEAHCFQQFPGGEIVCIVSSGKYLSIGFFEIGLHDGLQRLLRVAPSPGVRCDFDTKLPPCTARSASIMDIIPMTRPVSLHTML